jgi:ABC-type dipeptide/oligopeptide/nickel transport system permease component
LLGQSWYYRVDVNYMVGQRAPVTASLVFGSLIIWLAVSIPIGVLSALKPRWLLDRASMVFVLIRHLRTSGLDRPPARVSDGYVLGVTPIAGYCNFFGGGAEQCGGPVEWAYHLLLPWLTFTLLFAALYVRLIRANVMETLGEDYVRTARAQGRTRSASTRPPRAPELAAGRRHDARDGHRAGARRRHLHRDRVQPPRSRPAAPHLLQRARPADARRHRRLLDRCGDVFNLVVDIAYAFVDPRIRLT